MKPLKVSRSPGRAFYPFLCEGSLQGKKERCLSLSPTADWQTGLGDLEAPLPPASLMGRSIPRGGKEEGTTLHERDERIKVRRQNKLRKPGTKGRGRRAVPRGTQAGLGCPPPAPALLWGAGKAASPGMGMKNRQRGAQGPEAGRSKDEGWRARWLVQPQPEAASKGRSCQSPRYMRDEALGAGETVPRPRGARGKEHCSWRTGLRGDTRSREQWPGVRSLWGRRGGCEGPWFGKQEHGATAVGAGAVDSGNQRLKSEGGHQMQTISIRLLVEEARVLWEGEEVMLSDGCF